MNKKDIIGLIENDKWIMEILKTVQLLNLSDWWVGGGVIRSLVWDHLHGYTKRTKVPDVDVVYYDKNDFSKDEIRKISTKKELEYEKKLSKLHPKLPWSVTNQARMHIYHRVKPYKDSKEALSHWVETATAIAAKLDKKGKVKFTAYYGIDDLIGLKIRPISKAPNRLKIFRQRVQQKGWLKKWPKLKIVR